MEKTRLGVSVGMLGAAMYFMGLVSVLALVGLGVYILLYESNAWLKRTVIKAIAVVITFTLLSSAVGFSNDILGIVNDLLFWSNPVARFSWPLGLDSIAYKVINALEVFTLVILGIKAFTFNDIKIAPIDSVIDKNM